MARLAIVCLALLCSFAIVSCQGNALSGTAWELKQFNGYESFIDNGANLFFGEDLAYGSAACNPFAATYLVRGSELAFEVTLVNQIDCPQAIMGAAKAYLATLEQVKSYQIIEKQLEFFDERGNPLMVFSSLVPSSLTGENWVVEAFKKKDGGLVRPLPGSPILASFTTNNLLYGDTGCNQYSTSYSLYTKGKMSIEPAAVTLKICDPVLMEQEKQYLTLLNQTVRYLLSMNTLELRSFEGDLLVLFRTP
jgi:heat shock protein HslJ